MTVTVTDLLSLHSSALLLHRLLHALLPPAIQAHGHTLATPLLLACLVRRHVRCIGAAKHKGLVQRAEVRVMCLDRHLIIQSNVVMQTCVCGWMGVWVRCEVWWSQIMCRLGSQTSVRLLWRLL